MSLPASASASSNAAVAGGSGHLSWFGLYVAAVDRLGRWLRRPNVKARIEQVTGVVLLGVAVRLATAPH